MTRVKTSPAPASKTSLPTNPAQMAREAYDMFWKQAEEQWAQIARNPQFLGMMSTALEQSQQMRTKVQDIVTGTLKAMNLPTRDDYKAIMRKLDALSDQIEEISQKLEAGSAAQNPEPPAEKKKPAAKRTRKTT